MYAEDGDRWYPLQEAEGKLSDYNSATHPAHSSGTENPDKKIDELWSKFLSASRPTATIGGKSTWCCDVHLSELDSGGLPGQKCTCDCTSGNSHGDRGSRDAPDSLPSADTTCMSLQEACQAFKRVFIESSKRRQKDIKCRPTKGQLSSWVKTSNNDNLSSSRYYCWW